MMVRRPAESWYEPPPAQENRPTNLERILIARCLLKIFDARLAAFDPSYDG